MKKTIIPFLLLAAVTPLLFSCIIDDSGYGYSNGRYYDDYPPPPPGRYDEQYYDRYDDRYDGRYSGRSHRYDDRQERDRRSGHSRHGEFQAGGNAKEFPFSQGNVRCTITVVDGAVGFRTIVVRRGSAKQSVTINATYQRGQSFEVPIDRSATGIRISDTGRGRYRVAVH